jgi:uncharacterized membrane protein
MKLMRLAFRRETARPMLALLFASGVSMVLVAARIVGTRDVDRYGFLAWNLFLAWLPLIFALLACEEYRAASGRKARFAGLAGAWLLFFPNAPYIFTDVIHLTTRSYRHVWVDMVLILLCALIGLVLGFVSLFLMQGVVTRLWGRARSWVFVAAVAGLSGYGIYLGRFLRFNSWDVLFKPLALGRGIGRWAADPFGHPNSYAFPVLFSTFLFLAYLMLYALTHLQPAQFASATQNEPARI